MKPDLVKIMHQKAKKNPITIVVCEGWDERCLKAVHEVIKKKIAKIVLLGDPQVIKKKAKALNVNIDDAPIIDYQRSKIQPELAKKLVALREEKGMTIEEAEVLVKDVNYFGCLYAACGYADAIAGSAIGSTAELMKPTLQILRKKDTLVSELAILEDVKNKRILFGADFSMNIDPSVEDLAQITLNAVDCVQSFGIKPRVALLSFSTKGSGGDMPQLQKLREVVELVKQKQPKIVIDGELQVDAAVNPSVAKRKCPKSPLRGAANTLIFPNLMASNIFCHAMLQFSDMKILFALLVGLRKPVAILGRSTSAETVKNMIVCLGMQVNTEAR